MKKYSVKELSKLAGISVRTLHHYDKIGLLQPAERTAAGYRLYEEKELLLLQQILFYKELDFPLKEIKEILNEPDFDLIQALEQHQLALLSKQKHIKQMLATIKKTLLSLKNKTAMKMEELYEGFSAEEIKKMRAEATEKYGEKVAHSERYLKSLSKQQLEELKAEQKEIFKNLWELSQEDPQSEKVQMEMAQHYKNIRTFWGTLNDKNPQADQYKGLGALYVNDDRFIKVDGEPKPAFAAFLSKAMNHFAEEQLKE